MIILRQGKARRILEDSLNSAFTAVEIFNRPRTQFRVENYIVLMNIAWTKLFHAYFHATIGEKYYFKEKNGRFKKINGEKYTWTLSECIKKFKQKSDGSLLSRAMEANLRFFIDIRDRIEHRLWNFRGLGIYIFGECQSLLYNYETLIIKLFGEKYSMNTSLAYSLQFSQLRSDIQLLAQKSLLSKEMRDVKNYIDKYKSDLAQEIYDSFEYSVKLLLIPKISATNRGDLSLEFVHLSSAGEEDRKKYRKILGLIKDRVVKQFVLNGNVFKPKQVKELVEEKTGQSINMQNLVDLWRAFSIRPSSKSNNKPNTQSKYCLYDEAHDDYLYTLEWVNFISNLITLHGFTEENIHRKCAQHLNINDFL